MLYFTSNYIMPVQYYTFLSLGVPVLILYMHFKTTYSNSYYC